ncbi:MAG: hypothetical protein RIT45_2458 [Pseudomonadota bacterium]|jgi:hypothetical protein
MGSCNCKGEPIVAAIDQRFESEADGSAVIHWLDATTWARLGGKHALLHYFTLLGLDGTSTAVTLVARGGSDGKTWQPIEGLEHGPYSSGDVSTAPKRVYAVPSVDARLPPLVQLGLKVSASLDLGGVRVTWLIESIAGQGIPAIAADGSAINPGTGQVLSGSDPIDLLGELDVIFGGAASVAADIELHTSGDGTNWYLADTLTLAAGASGSRKAVNMLRYAQLVNKNAIVGTVGGSLSAVTRG